MSNKNPARGVLFCPLIGIGENTVFPGSEHRLFRSQPQHVIWEYRRLAKSMRALITYVGTASPEVYPRSLSIISSPVSMLLPKCIAADIFGMGYSLNHPFVLFAIFTKISITGTSVRTPTIVASAAGDFVPKSEIATATANSKKFEAPIIPAGAAMS